MAIIVSSGFEVAIATGFSFSGGAGTIDTGVFYAGASSARFADQDYVGMNHSASKTVAYATGFLRVSTITPSANSALCLMSVAAGADMYLQMTTAGVLRLAGGDAPITGPTLTANTWWGFEMERDSSANPHVVRWRTCDPATGNWTAQTNGTYTNTASTANQVFFEHDGATYSVYFDAVAAGEGTVQGEHYPTTRANFIPIQPTAFTMVRPQ